MRVRFLTHVTLMLGLASLVFIACLTSELYRLRMLHSKAGAQRVQSVNRVATITVSFAAPPESWLYERPGNPRGGGMTNGIPVKTPRRPRSASESTGH